MRADQPSSLLGASPRGRIPVPRWPALSARDATIVALARRKLHGTRAELEDAVRALREAVEESLPAGRVFLLGTTAGGPIIGSLISGIGIAAGAAGVELLHVGTGGVCRWLGRFAP